MNYNILEGDLKDKIIPILTEIIDHNFNEVDSIYEDMKISKNENDWSKTLNSNLLCEYLRPFKDSFGLGIDFPIWFDWNTNKSKVMLIGRDPQRNHNDNRLIIGSPFGLGNKGGRETRKNKYWEFTEPLIENHRVYITDVYKLFTKDKLESKNLKKNKEFHYYLLAKEIQAINPNKIITIGKDAKIAVSTIYENQLEYYKNESYVKLTDSLELFFVPHISNMVLQNLIPIANLFLSLGKLKNNSTLEQIGTQILNEKENLFKK